ncbi:MAG: hypothetical protein F6J97_17760 [Leptolyngbya sp. SIO4C1]|nr:hypothetical protein [Leptolyngbya sp. SIO4C1]
MNSTIVPFDGPSVGDFGGPEFYDILDIGGGSFGAGVNFAFSDNLVLDLGYSTGDGNNGDIGIFDNYEYIAQLNFLSDGLIDAAVAYLDGNAEGGEAVDYVIAGLLNLDFGGFEVGGYYAFVEDEDGFDVDDSWMAGASFTDFLSTGNTLGAYVGESSNEAFDFVAEGYYEFALNEFITITPAILYAELDDDDDDAFYGVLRTTFRF